MTTSVSWVTLDKLKSLCLRFLFPRYPLCQPPSYYSLHKGEMFKIYLPTTWLVSHFVRLYWLAYLTTYAGIWDLLHRGLVETSILLHYYYQLLRVSWQRQYHLQKQEKGQGGWRAPVAWRLSAKAPVSGAASQVHPDQFCEFRQVIWWPGMLSFL